MVKNKTRFEEIRLINLPDEGLVFNAQKIGPGNFKYLRNADYGKGFRMATIPEIVQLIYASFENKGYGTAKKVIKTLDYGITGNTGILYTPKGMFVQDNPNFENEKISMNKKNLEKKLGSQEEKRVVFSENKTIRFVPYVFNRQSQSALELARNPGVIALTGSKKNAEKLAKASEHYKICPDFWAWNEIEVRSPRIRVVSLSDVNKISINASEREDSNILFSFGVKE